MAVVFQAAAAQRRARQAEHAEFYIRFATSGLRASPYVESIPPPSEIHAAALLCLLRKMVDYRPMVDNIDQWPP